MSVIVFFLEVWVKGKDVGIQIILDGEKKFSGVFVCGLFKVEDKVVFFIFLVDFGRGKVRFELRFILVIQRGEKGGWERFLEEEEGYLRVFKRFVGFFSVVWNL